MSDEQPSCGNVVEHPELGELVCELPAGHEGLHRTVAPDNPAEGIEWDDEPAVEQQRADFDLEAFVKSLPPGVGLCPLCIGLGAVDEDPPFDPHTHPCGTCKGHGRTRTGSLLGEQAYRKCDDCDGRGWVANEPGRLPASPARSADFQGELPPRDSNGRTPDDADFDWTSIVRDVEPLPAPEPA